MSEFLNNNYKKIIGIGLPVLGIGLVLYYIFFCGKTELHADCMDTIMWANASYESGSLFDRDFNYACLLPFGGQLLMQPFMYIFGLSYKVHITGMVLFLVLFMASFIFMLRGMDLSLFKRGSLAFGLLMFTCCSKKLREIFWGHIIYYSLGLMFLFVGLGLIFRIIKYWDKKDKKAVVFSSLVFVWTMLCASDGIQALTIYILPAVCAIVGYIAFDFDEELISSKNVFKIQLSAVMLMAAVCGIVITSLLSKGITQSYASAYSRFNNDEEWFENLSTLLSCHYTLLGVNVNNKMDIMSFEGVINILRIIFATMVAIAPFFGIMFYTRIKNKYTKMFLIAYFAIYALIMIGWVFGKISGVNWRLTPIETAGFILTVLLIYELMGSKIYIRTGGILIIPLMLFCLISVGSVIGISTDYKNENKIFKEIQLLEDEGCTYGYGTFWNANHVTVLTENKIKVRGMEIKDGEIKKRTYQSRESWYTGKTDKNEKYFIILTEKEYKNTDISNYPVDEIIEKDGFVLITLKENISFD